MMNVRDANHQNRHHTLPLFADITEFPEALQAEESDAVQSEAVQSEAVQSVGLQKKSLQPKNPKKDLKANQSDRLIRKHDLQRSGGRRRRRPVNPHLAAARKLSKDIRRLPDGSQEQTLTGRAICQHLRALLRETEMQGR